MTTSPVKMEKLIVKNVSKAFDGRGVLEDISISLREGELVSLLGVSGGGKTTLFNIIAGLLPPDRGEVYLNGETITGQSGHVSYMLQKDLLLPYRTVEDNVALPLILKGVKLNIDELRQKMGMVFQHFNLFPHMTILENMTLAPMKVKGVKKEEARKQAGELFADFGLAGTEKLWPAQLSGGMRQRAALLRTYLFSKDVALLDEPFSALDTLTKSAVHDWYLGVMERIRLSTLFITHDIDEAILLSDRIYLLTGQPGKVTAEIVIDAPRPRRKDFTLTAEFLAYKKQILAALGQ